MHRIVPALVAALALLAASGPAPAQFLRAPKPDNLHVDLELILAVDVSGSVDAFEARLQRQGYIDAFHNPKLMQAIRNGRFGRIAVTYLEWAGWGSFRQTVDWTLIGDEEGADAFTRQIARADLGSYQGTSISGAIGVSMQLFGLNPFQGDRRTIDISGDGPNNQGLSVVYYRDQAVAAGITINGLPILSDQGNVVSELDVYYRECVIGGPGAFVIAAQSFESFSEAILRKLILEIAAVPEDAVEQHGIIRVQFLQPGRPGGNAGPMFEGPPRYFPYCDVPNRSGPTIFPRPGQF